MPPHRTPPPTCSLPLPTPPSQEDVDDVIADELIAAAPGLFLRDLVTGKLKVTNARDHEKHLEKV